MNSKLRADAIRPYENSKLRILIATDVFPPKCGGSGWSSYYLACALRERGHHVVIARPRIGAKRDRLTDYDGFIVHEYAHPDLPLKLPILTNYQRNERLYAAFRRFLLDLIKRERIDIVHGQNGLSIPPAVMAAEAAGIASVSTIRDWWALCYFGTLRHGDVACHGCTVRDLARGLLHIAGAKGVLGWPLIPYMRANLRLKRRWLARSSRIIAVSNYAAMRLRPYVPADKVRVVPNIIDFGALSAILQNQDTTQNTWRTQSALTKTQNSYWVFAGKLEPNKGVEMLVPALATAKTTWPTLVLGDGKLRESLALAAEAAGVGLNITPWLPNDEALRQMAKASGLLFPSAWPEPLSRVLLEASALGLPIVAMNTGGTPDIIRDGETSLLATDLSTFAAAIARLEADPALCTRLGVAAREHARANFSKEVVVPQVEGVYAEALAKKP
ncbi:MAG: glycosyltransferase family 1 protein [Candidatus Chloroheliales bacterium]|nr:MAG: glycosyltransferase family 1 protein [Chloroflexota bacterium]